MVTFPASTRSLGGPTYDPVAVAPMRKELTDLGFIEMLTPDAVDQALNAEDGKTTLMVINSVCGCAAGNARPGVALALQHSKIPDRLVTSFAGQEKDAVQRIREHLDSIPPSSPFIALFRDGKPVMVLERRNIEGRSADDVAMDLARAFEENCHRQGPAIDPEEFQNMKLAKYCGRTIPLFQSA